MEKNQKIVFLIGSLMITHNALISKVTFNLNKEHGLFVIFIFIIIIFTLH